MPDEALEHFRGRGERGQQARGRVERARSRPTATSTRSRRRAVAAISGAHARRLGRRRADVPPDDEARSPPARHPSQVIQWAAAKRAAPGGRLGRPRAARRNTEIDDGGSVAKGDYGGRNIHFGVREHGMGAIVNGLDLHGLRAFGVDVPQLLRLHEGADAPGGADGAAVDLRLHPRLDRARRGRADPPADRAARHAARDAATSTWSARPTRTRPRWRGGSRSTQTDAPGRVGAHPPGPADARSRARSPTTRSSAAPTCCATRRRRAGR